MSTKTNPLRARAGAQRAAWAHAQRIVDREASFDVNGWSVV